MRPRATTPESGLVCASCAMRRFVTELENAAPSEVPVLIWGEPGVGKERAARALHRLSSRGTRPLEVIRCSGLDGTALQAALMEALPQARGGSVLLPVAGSSMRRICTPGWDAATCWPTAPPRVDGAAVVRAGRSLRVLAVPALPALETRLVATRASGAALGGGLRSGRRSVPRSVRSAPSCSSSLTTSGIVGRASACLASMRITSTASSAGSVGSSLASSGGGSNRCRAMISPIDWPGKGRVPDSIWNSITPRE